MTSNHIVLSLVAAAGLLACGVARDVHGSDGGGACTGCHGDASRSGTPLQRAAPATGAHLAHIAGDVACGSCHVVPDSPAHADDAVQVAFTGLSVADGATPTFVAGTCANVYCHGATLNAGGAGAVPVEWSGPPLACASCHGAPPPSHDPGSTLCAGCHPGTVRVDGTIDRATRQHVNAFLEGGGGGGGGGHAAGWGLPANHGPAAKQDLDSCRLCHGPDLAGSGGASSCGECHTGGAAWASNCTFCHGTKTSPYAAADLAKAAPPRGSKGETATTVRAVGAHQTHLSGGSFGGPVACAECHAVPSDLSHLDGTARVTFGAAAKRDLATPAWNGTTCSNVYCHGGTLAGGSIPAPSWTGSGQATCGSCHGLPPTGSHTTSTACAGCHGYDGATFDAALHLNGTVDLAGGTSCSSCHGIPPSTGRHSKHVGGEGFGCGECHPGYSASAVNPATHQDGTKDVGGVSGWNATTRSCSMECHGKTHNGLRW
jgi:predicted CxxxxCH...CXXCH cytochrome family protein